MAKLRGLGFLGVAASGTTFTLLEGRTEYNESWTHGLVDATDADDTSVTFGTYETSLAGDGEGQITFTGTYSGGAAQQILQTALETGASIVGCWGKAVPDSAAPYNLAVTDFKCTDILVESVDIKSDTSVQTFSATLRINTRPVAAEVTDVIVPSATGAAGKARGRTLNVGAYVNIDAAVLANITSLSYSGKRSLEDATDSDSANWKTFLAKDYTCEISGSCNDADTAGQIALKTKTVTPAAITLIYGFRPVAATAGCQKYTVQAMLTKVDAKHPRGGMRTIDFSLKTVGLPVRATS